MKLSEAIVEGRKQVPFAPNVLVNYDADGKPVAACALGAAALAVGAELEKWPLFDYGKKTTEPVEYKTLSGEVNTANYAIEGYSSEASFYWDESWGVEPTVKTPCNCAVDREKLLTAAVAHLNDDHDPSVIADDMAERAAELAAWDSGDSSSRQIWDSREEILSDYPEKEAWGEDRIVAWLIGLGF